MATYFTCLEKSHGPRSLMGYSPWGLKELDTTVTKHTRTNQEVIFLGTEDISLVSSAKIMDLTLQWILFLFIKM